MSGPSVPYPDGHARYVVEHLGASSVDSDAASNEFGFTFFRVCRDTKLGKSPDGSC